MIAGIVVNCIAAVFSGLSTVLMRRGTQEIDPDAPNLMRALRRNRIWRLGALSLLMTAILTAISFRLAPIPVVQPFAALGLVFLVIFARPILGEIPGRQEYVGMAIIVVGLVPALLLVGDEEPLEQISALTFITVIGSITALCVLLIALHRNLKQKYGDAAGVLIGSVAGLLLGVAVAMFRIIGVWRDPGADDWVPPLGLGLAAIAILVVFGWFGFRTLQHGLREHRATSVAPGYQVLLLITPIVVAVTAYGQTLPGGTTAQMIRITSLAVVVVGVIVLSTSGAVAEDEEVIPLPGDLPAE